MSPDPISANSLSGTRPSFAASPDGRRLYGNEALPASGTANMPSLIRVSELPRGE